MNDRTLWETALPALAECVQRVGGIVEWRLDPPATPPVLADLESDIGTALPSDLRRFFLTVSGHLFFHAVVPDNAALPQEACLDDWGLSVSVNAVRLAETARKEWVREVYSDPEDPYSAKWQNKLGFLNLCEESLLGEKELAKQLQYGDWTYGDNIAFDLSAGSAESRPLVYLSHDGFTDRNGMTVAPDFKTYLRESLALACAGAGYWAIGLFNSPNGEGLRSDTESARTFLDWLGWKTP